MSNQTVDFKAIDFASGDLGTHCNSCDKESVYSVSVNGMSIRLCRTCAFDLFGKIGGTLEVFPSSWKERLVEARDLVEWAFDGHPMTFVEQSEESEWATCNSCGMPDFKHKPNCEAIRYKERAKAFLKGLP